jgi:F-type H+-transporting ATPase subunit c
MDGIFYAKAAAFIGAAIAIGIGSIGPALGQGLVGMKACESLGKNPQGAGPIRNAMILAMVIVESTAIYCLLIAGAILWLGSRLY